MTIKNIDFRNEERTAILRYLNAKTAKAEAEAEEKAAKTAIKELFARMGKAFKENEKTEYLYGTVQVQGKAKAVVYKETTAKGTIDWQAYAMALGGNLVDAEQYRKDGNVRTALDWASDKQNKELGL